MTEYEQRPRSWWGWLAGWLRRPQRAEAARKARAALQDLREGEAGRKAREVLRDLRQGQAGRTPGAGRDLRDGGEGRDEP